MDASLEIRLNSESPFYDASLFNSLAKLGGDYVRNGLAVLNFYVNDFDSAYDVANALAAMPDGTTFSQFDKTDRSMSRNYSHPCGSTQLEVLATAISQILFGGETNRRVTARNDDDEVKVAASSGSNDALASRRSGAPTALTKLDRVPPEMRATSAAATVVTVNVVEPHTPPTPVMLTW